MCKTQCKFQDVTAKIGWNRRVPKGRLDEVERKLKRFRVMVEGFLEICMHVVNVKEHSDFITCPTSSNAACESRLVELLDLLCHQLGAAICWQPNNLVAVSFAYHDNERLVVN